MTASLTNYLSARFHHRDIEPERRNSLKDFERENGNLEVALVIRRW
jgi:hypothetical protein